VSDVTSTHTPDDGHGDVVPSTATGGAVERFENPGLPEHRHRMADTDPRAAKRAERQVAALFAISAIGTLLVIVSYVAVQVNEGRTWLDRLHNAQLSNLYLGLGFFLALFGIGAGAVHWAKTLMPDDERVEYRHQQRGSDADRAGAVAILKEGAGEAGLGRRPLIRNTLIGAMALVPLPGLLFLRDLGPAPGNRLRTTLWHKGLHLVKDPEGGRIKASDLTVGSLIHVVPEGLEEAPNYLVEKGKAAVLLIRLEPELVADLADGDPMKLYQGIVAYSKICTHLGCPVALYEHQTHHLLCPCHQSTFDVTQGCKVIYGPAKRPLPRLAITVDTEGYLVAQDAFTEPVGPSFWERG
jgi:ubiquinol-cytochrome c reductase iron-sulfur subunit